MNFSRLDRVLVPLLLVSAAGAAAFGLLFIWSPAENEWLSKLLKSCVVLAITSGFVLSATRLGGSGVRQQS